LKEDRVTVPEFEEPIVEEPFPPPGDSSGADDPDSGMPRPQTGRGRRRVRDFAETLLLVIAVYVLINLLTARFVVEGDSMQPNFTTGEYIIVNRIAYLVGQPARGDVIVFSSPESPYDDLIKRVIGLPGETVRVEDYRVFIDDVPLDEPYINAAPRYTGSWTLGPDEYFVLGDNRNYSRDSHVFGPLTRDRIIGQAAVIYWPPEFWEIVPHHSFAGVPESSSSMSYAALPEASWIRSAPVWIVPSAS
jgi:signal peptidase I